MGRAAHWWVLCLPPCSIFLPAKNRNGNVYIGDARERRAEKVELKYPKEIFLTLSREGT